VGRGHAGVWLFRLLLGMLTTATAGLVHSVCCSLPVCNCSTASIPLPASKLLLIPAALSTCQQAWPVPPPACAGAHLLKAQELDDAEGDAGVVAQAALVGPNGAVELHAVAAVHLGAAGIIQPGHPATHHTWGAGT
jgi:hypothetical protein